MFHEAFKHVIGLEGGYVNDVRDPGGETKYGITKRDHPTVDIKALTLEDAGRIYKIGYWDPAHCEHLPWPLAGFVFDAAVNQGVPVAVKLLQKAVGTVQDGVIGKNTLAAIARHDQGELCALFMADRALRYTGTRNFDIYGRGWLKRLFKLAMEV
jgi:lysozyme family protein